MDKNHTNQNTPIPGMELICYFKCIESKKEGNRLQC